jgi:hypothetical protein
MFTLAKSSPQLGGAILRRTPVRGLVIDGWIQPVHQVTAVRTGSFGRGSGLRNTATGHRGWPTHPTVRSVVQARLRSRVDSVPHPG